MTISFIRMLIAHMILLENVSRLCSQVTFNIILKCFRCDTNNETNIKIDWTWNSH